MFHFIEHVPHDPVTRGPGVTLPGDGQGRPVWPLEALGLLEMIVIPRKTFVRMEVIPHVDTQSC